MILPERARTGYKGWGLEGTDFETQQTSNVIFGFTTKNLQHEKTYYCMHIRLAALRNSIQTITTALKDEPFTAFKHVAYNSIHNSERCEF